MGSTALLLLLVPYFIIVWVLMFHLFLFFIVFPHFIVSPHLTVFPHLPFFPHLTVFPHLPFFCPPLSITQTLRPLDRIYSR